VNDLGFVQCRAQGSSLRHASGSIASLQAAATTWSWWFPLPLWRPEADPHRKKDADLDDQLNLSWCIGHLSDILEDHRMEELKSKQTPKAISICLPEGATDAGLLLIVLDELQARDRSATLGNVITSTLSVWWPCKR
jgi:hypothetical protein